MEVQIAAQGGDVGKSIAIMERDPHVGQSVMLAGGREPGTGTIGSAPDATTQTVVLSRPKDERYVIGRELGRGGLGRVLLALDRDLSEREVAMKVGSTGSRERMAPGGCRKGRTPTTWCGRRISRWWR